ncbi:hypothetical protein PybrP1_007226 [[Pythium] brassicae (nom. inval.)]|nr:hypothetical protein PybrP1_007226 [[Pythium] brassicae (nom. inval.)]
MRTIQQPVFEFIEAPKLTNWSHDALVKWTQRRHLHEDHKAVVDATSGELETLIDSRVKFVKNAQIPDLDEFFKQNLSIDMREDDIDARILKYFRDFSSVIEKNGFSSILGIGKLSEGGYANTMKLRCTVLIENLEPSMLHNDVRRYAKYECREAFRNDFTLFGVIRERASAQHKYHVMTRERKAKSPPLKKDKFLERAPSKPYAAPKPKLDAMVIEAGDNEFDPSNLQSLREVVLDYEGVFQFDLLADPPALVEPLRVT